MEMNASRFLELIEYLHSSGVRVNRIVQGSKWTYEVIGCDGVPRYTEQWAERQGIPIEALEKWFLNVRNHDCACDCSVLFSQEDDKP